MKNFDISIRGTGVVGQALSLSMAKLGLHVALVPQDHGRRCDQPDVRAFALNAASKALLVSLKVWDALPQHAATPVHDMRISGDAPAGVLAFSAWQQQVSELAHITDAAQLEQALVDAVRYAPHITLLAQEPPAALRLLCEGKASSTREGLGAVFERQDHGQCAIAARVTTPQPHQNTAHQWFNSPDVLALLPFDSPKPHHSFALVWSMPTAQAQAFMALDAAEFETQLAQATHTLGVPLKLASERASWPLLHGRATTWCGPGWALVGDCAHVVHPLAGQGLNLGLADVSALCSVIAQREPWRALGDARLLRRYERMRLMPTQAMGQLTSGLLQLFSSQNATLRTVRNHGMGMLNQLTPIKRWLTHRAINNP
jgi:2-polyprenyl-6-methoxyphenol hydroxylase-like FAD-dependent oxidoreductase